MTAILPTISVVMPVYNGVRFLARAIESLHAQTFSDWELLVVDDGSTDDSAALLDQFAQSDHRIRMFRQQNNRGLSAARNTALRAARGKLIAYLDCDDEFYPDHFAHVWEHSDRAEVLLFQYDLAEERPNHPRIGTVTTYDPSARANFMFSETISVPLGVVHQRSLLDRVGGFNESLGRFRGQDEDGDLWRRFAQAGATFAAVPYSSGLYHIRADSLARTRSTPPPPTVMTPSPKPRVMFASYHCYHDPSSGAAICTRDLFAALAARGWRCGAFTGPYLDDHAATPIGVSLKSHPGLRSAPGTAGVTGFGIYTVDGPGGFPVTIYAPNPPAPAKLPSAEEATGFLAIFAEILRRFHPDIVLTYGGDPASRGIASVARQAGARVAFWLHNFSYTHANAFAGCDAVIVPSAFSREHYRTALGLNCVALPPVIDVNRILVPRPDRGRYVTFVNPEPNKGVFWFARLAEVLGRARPDIPFLVVEGRGRTNWVRQSGVNLHGMQSIHRMSNTPDPRQFYQQTRLALMPSIWRESFGRVAAEAMLNGIPVLSSDRGALPEVVGNGGKCLPIPTLYTPESRTAPTSEEVIPWVDAVLGLWDDLGGYEVASAAARAASLTWHPEAVIPRWEAYLTHFAARADV